MTDAERQALDDVRGFAGAHRIRISRHADIRMMQRSATYNDLHHALMHATNCVAQAHGKWKVEGVDLDGDDLTAVVVFEGGVVVVTMF